MTQTHTTQKTVYKPRLWAFFMFIVGLGVLAYALITVKGWKDNKPTRPPRPKVQSLPFVETQSVQISDNPIIVTAGGFVAAKNTANITTQVSGKIIEVSPQLQVGQRLQQGETLLHIDPTNYQVALSNAKADLALAKASLATAKANQLASQSRYELAQAQSRQAGRDIKSLKLKATRLNLKQPQLDAAKADVDNAMAAIDSAMAKIDSAKAQITLAETNLARTTLTAPFDAIVQSVNTAVGEMATSGKVLMTLAATDIYTVKLTLDKRAIKHIQLNDPVTLTDTIYGQTYQANLTRFSPEIDSTNRTLAVYVDIQAPLRHTKPLFLGSYLTARITGKTIANSAYLPNSAIVEDRYVWEKRADDSIAPLGITVLDRQNQRALVTFDAVPGALITRPKASFVAGQKVTTDNTVKRRKKRPKYGQESDQQPDQQSPPAGKEKPANKQRQSRPQNAQDTN